MKHATVAQTRRLRDGRQLIQIASSSLAYMPCGDNRAVWLDGAGNPVR